MPPTAPAAAPGTIVALALLAAAAFVLRFAGSWLVLALAPEGFDAHGFGLVMHALILLVLASPLALWLALVLHPRRPWRGWLAPAATPGRTAASWGLALLVAAPLPEQVHAVRLLPPQQSWPALLSAALWFAVVLALRPRAVRPPA